ncbi:MAG: thiamine diphosphokinase [Paludibacteraceae bacterium]|nr:thiamine diphosphokinase [Paludibacteraceae bacterium]
MKKRKFDALIIGNGEFPQHPDVLSLMKEIPFVACCDGGANEYISRGLLPDIIIGDGDSLSEENKAKYSHLVHYVSDQETNDQTKAVNWLMKQEKRHIAIVGACGKREDHTLGNISLLMEYQKAGAEVRSYTNYGVFIPCKGSRCFQSKAGQQVSIFNISAKNMSANGLRYPIYDFTSWWQGTLNECTGEEWSVNAEGEYLVFINY